MNKDTFKNFFRKEKWKSMFVRDKAKKPRAGMVVKPSAVEIIFDVIIYAILILMAFIFIIPLWHVLMSSFSVGQKLNIHEGIVWWPIDNQWNFGGYELLLKYPGILTGYGNTLLYVVGGTALGLVINVIGGYCMYRKSMLQKFFVVYVMITMLFSGGVIPTFMVINSLGMVNTHFAVIFTTCTSALYVILTMNAFRGVSPSLVEAAEMDGAGHLRIMFQIMLPQCVSMISVVLLFTVVGIWNGWFEAKLYLTKNVDAWPLQLWINRIATENESFMQQTRPDWNKLTLQSSVIIVATLPILIIATVFQKYIERGVILGGVKE